MAWFSKGRKKGRRLVRTPSKTARKYGNKARRFNKKYKIIGSTPDNFISPIDATPLGFYNRGKKAQKVFRRSINSVKSGYKASKSRGRQNKSSSSRRKPRGKYYYYRGKRIYRK